MSVNSYEFLLEWDHAGTTWYFSRFGAITVGGHAYTPRLVDVPAVSGIYIDRTYADWADASFNLDNLDDDWGTDFFFTARDAEDDFEDDEVRFYSYDRATGTKKELFTGFVKRPTFGSTDYTCSFEATFPVNAIEMQVPSWFLGVRCAHFYNGSTIETAGGTIPSAGCTWTLATGLNPEFPDAQADSCDKSRKGPNGCKAHNNLADFGGLTHIAKVTNGEPNNTLDKEDVREAVAPIVIGTEVFKVRPIIYRADLSENELIVNGIISTCHPGLPFDESQFEAHRFRLWGELEATSVEIYYGSQPQAIPGDRDLFPEEAGHGLWCYFAATWAITPAQYDRAQQDSLKRDIHVKIDGGRKILRGGAVTENPVYATEDVLRDRVNGLGWPSSRIDSSSVTATASYVGPRFRIRLELDRPMAAMDWLQEMLGSWHGYAFYEAGKLGFGPKRHDETAVATFGTGGYPIVGVEPTQKDYAELVTGALFKYRDLTRQGHKIPRRDPGAQLKAANGGLTKTEWERVFLHGIYDDVEAQISSAIWMREEINLNYFVPFRTPLPDWNASGVRVGQVIRINDPLIVDNDTNYLFRVIGWTLDPETYEIAVETQIYDGAVYAYNADELGDIIRDGAGPSTGGRPPDVEDVAAEIVDVYIDEGDPANSDDDTRMARIECSAVYPDLSAKMEEDREDGLITEYPIIGYRILHRFTDEPALTFAIGPFVKYPETVGHLEVPFHKKRSVEILFAAVARNNSYGEVGYVLDRARTTYVDEDVDATEPAITVGDGALFAAGDLVRSESEFMTIAPSGVSGDTLTMVDSGGSRVPQFGSEAAGHPEGTGIGVVVLSHPSVVVDMSVRRYTLPVVEDVTARSRPKGIRVKWADIDPDATERYFVYWSTYYTAGPFIHDLLGDASDFVVNWQDQDPKNPPEGIFLLKSKDLDKIIQHEDIDATTLGALDASHIDVQIRVAAKIKNNYSSALSELAVNRHGNAPAGPPSDPKLADISYEEVAENARRARVLFTIAAKEEDPYTATFQERNMTLVGAVIEKWSKALDDWSGVLKRVGPEEVEDDELPTTTVEKLLPKGSKWRWVRSFAKNRGSRRKATDNFDMIVFTVGNLVDDITTITDFEIAPFENDPGLYDEDLHSTELDPRHSLLLHRFTMPSDIVALDRIDIRKKKDAATRWNRVPSRHLLGEDQDDDGNSMFTPGMKLFRETVQHPKNEAMDYQARLVAADGSKTSWFTLDATSGAEGGGAGLEDTVAPGAPTNPRILFRDRHLRLRCTRPTTGNNTIVAYEWELSDGTTVANGTKWLTDADPPGVAVASPKISDAVTVTPSDFGDSLNSTGTKLPIPIRKSELVSLFGSGAALYMRVRAYNLSTGGDQQGAWSTVAGPFVIATGESAEDTAAPSAPGTPTARFKKGNFRLKTTKPTSNDNTIYQYEWQICSANSFPDNAPDGEAWYVTDNDAAPLDNTDFHSILTSGVKNVVPLQKRDLTALTGPTVSNLFFRVRARNRFNGGTDSAWSSTGSIAVSALEGDGPEDDTIAPNASLLPVPVLRSNRKGIRGRIVGIPRASDGFRNIVKYGWVIQSSDNTTYMTEDGVATTSRATAEFFTTDNRFNLHVKRRDVSTALRAGMKVLCRVFNLLGEVETAATGGTSIQNTLPTGGGTTAGYAGVSTTTAAMEKDAFNDEDGISTKRKAHADAPLVEGGDFKNGRGGAAGSFNTGGAPTEAGQQWRVQKTSASLGRETYSNQNNKLSTIALYGVTWNRAKHRAEFTISGAGIAARIGKLAASGQWFSVCALVGYTAASGTAPTLTGLSMQLLEIDNATVAPWDDGAVTAVISSALTLGTAIVLPDVDDTSPVQPYVFLGAYFRLDPAYVPSTRANLFWAVSPTWTGGTSPTICLDQIQLFPNSRDVRPFAPGPIESSLDAIVQFSAVPGLGTVYDDAGGLNDGNAAGSLVVYTFN